MTLYKDGGKIEVVVYIQRISGKFMVVVHKLTIDNKRFIPIFPLNNMPTVESSIPYM